MEGYLFTKDAEPKSGPRIYIHQGTVYIPKLDLKIKYLRCSDTVEVSPIYVYEIQYIRYLEELDEPVIKKIDIDDSKIQSLESLLKEKEELPRRIEEAARDIFTQANQK